MVNEGKYEVPEPPELRTVYEEALEHPIQMDEDTPTMLANETWSTIEKVLENSF